MKGILCEDRLFFTSNGQVLQCIFEALLFEYQRAPRVTRDRLYLEAIEEIYGNSNKVFIDAEGGGNLLYLPLDQLVRGSNRQLPGAESNRSADTQTEDILSLEERDAEDPRTRNRREPR